MEQARWRSDIIYPETALMEQMGQLVAVEAEVEAEAADKITDRMM
jgi:hypothetical protein